MNARRGPAFYRVSNLDGEQVGEAAEFSNGSVAVSLYSTDEDAPPEVFDDLDAARRGTSGVVFEARRGPTRPGEREVSLRWELPDNPEDALTLYRHDAIIHALVETSIADDPALDVPEDVFAACDVLRVSAYRVGIMPTGPLAETALPDAVEVVEPIADGGTSRPDADGPERWLEYTVETDGRFVYVSNEYGTESYTVEQARGLSAAISQAADLAEQGDRRMSDDVRTDGGRSFSTQPETCPECGLTLDANGECKTNGCPGPE